jgi:dsDNA-specific endonuclease/ATPase MutS2
MLTISSDAGKSVYLKTVGLLQFMSQIGAFVPAEDGGWCVISRLIVSASTNQCYSQHSLAQWTKY